MLIHEINQDIINKVQVDNYKRVSGIFLIDKPVGVTSHDIVDDVRKVLRTKRVGHAGALDPFADGLLIVLVGKYTQYTDVLISQDKSYIAEVLLGISTDTQDPEGKVTAVKNMPTKLTGTEIETAFTAKYLPDYEQIVPIFSSVKVNGHKLRVLARQATSFEIDANDHVTFSFDPANKPKGLPAGINQITLKVPRKPVKLTSFEVGEIQHYKEIEMSGQLYEGDFATARVMVDCSKGTYIRQLAEDLGKAVDLPACLIELKRTRIADFDLNNTLELKALYDAAVDAGIPNKPLSELGLKSLEL